MCYFLQVINRTRLDRHFFSRPTLECTRDLLGKILVSRAGPNGGRLAGMINETEAYIATEDLACHARSGRTPRNAVMWGPPGHAYVYFTYGMHWCLNFVTEEDGLPAAVLIRSILPLEGIDTIRSNRNGRPDRDLTNGPAKLTQALGIDGSFNGLDLCAPDSPLFVEDASTVPDSEIQTGPRIGLNSVPEPWKSIPWRFFTKPGTQ